MQGFALCVTRDNHPRKPYIHEVRKGHMAKRGSPSKTSPKQAKIYLVGEWDPESEFVESVHTTHQGALKAWEKIRRMRLRQARAHLKQCDKWGKEMYREMVENLSCKNPEKINNDPWETPYIKEIKLEE